MVPDWSRRAIIRRITLAAVPIAAGCLSDDEADDEQDVEEHDPDEGRDSYGVHVYNESRWEHTVDVVVELTYEDGTVFEETVVLDEGESETWHGVITEEKDHTVTAIIESDEADITTPEDSIWVTPGDERAPPDANVRLRIDEINLVDGGLHSLAYAYLKSRD